ncbi:hypothetical protein [Vibrio alginolyticus]|uniref:hypothetical protein n=1 Tax=Vibrio alginolyticus TaxID=663 RepID=UPI0008034F27|nr:hypothetical protein [Vibrio alginolyticus]ANP64996.1 hypothetical protein BAU10_08325 [Vibrio alginolyticus]
MSSFPDLLTSFDDAVQALKVKLSQDPSSSTTYNGELIQSIAKDVNDRWAAIQSLVDSALVFDTKALMDDYTPTPNAEGFYPLAKVWNDTDASNNGTYGWDGSWSKSKILEVENSAVSNIIADPCQRYAMSVGWALKAPHQSTPGSPGYIGIGKPVWEGISSGTKVLNDPDSPFYGGYTLDIGGNVDKWSLVSNAGLKAGDKLHCTGIVTNLDAGSQTRMTAFLRTYDGTDSYPVLVSGSALTFEGSTGTVKLEVILDVPAIPDDIDLYVMFRIETEGTLTGTRKIHGLAAGINGTPDFREAENTGLPAFKALGTLPNLYFDPDCTRRVLIGLDEDEYGDKPVADAGSPSGFALRVEGISETLTTKFPVDELGLQNGKWTFLRLKLRANVYTSALFALRDRDGTALYSRPIGVLHGTPDKAVDNEDVTLIFYLDYPSGDWSEVDRVEIIYTTGQTAVLPDPEFAIYEQGIAQSASPYMGTPDFIPSLAKQVRGNPENLMPDPCNVQYAEGLNTHFGRSKWRSNPQVIDDLPSNPFNAPCVGGAVKWSDQDVAWDVLNMKEGNTLFVRLGIVARSNGGAGRVGLNFYARAGDDSVIATSGTVYQYFPNDDQYHYVEIEEQLEVTAEMEANAALVMLRNYSVTGDSDEQYIVCTFVGKRAYTGRLEYTSRLADLRAVATSVTETGVKTIPLPSQMGILEGPDSETSMYFSNIFGVSYWPDDMYLQIDGAYGQHFEHMLRFRDGESGMPSNNENFNMTWRLRSLADSTDVTSKQVNVTAVNPANGGSQVRYCAIGDSITRDGSYAKQVQDVLLDAASVGTRRYSGEDFAREGRGGWKWEHYHSRYGVTNTVDSPFMFPVNVSGDMYFGNTDNWKKIITEDPTGYDYAGFQDAARDFVDGGAYKYDAGTGYRLNPPTGAHMIDPSYPEGQQLRMYDGANWVIATDPTQDWEFSWGKYLQQTAYAHAGGKPTHVSLMSVANDFLGTDSMTDAAWTPWKERTDKLIASVHADDPSTKVIIVLGILGSAQAAAYENRYPCERFNEVVRDHARRVLDEYDTADMRSNNVYVSPMYINLDYNYGFDTNNISVNKYVAETFSVPGNMLHPNSIGHKMMGDIMAATIQRWRS